MNIELIPLERFIINGSSIPLGASRTDVETLLGKGYPLGNRRYYFENQMSLEYDTENALCFLEISNDIDGALRPTIDGIPVFETSADRFSDCLRQKNHGKSQVLENGHTVIFSGLGIGLYRERTPHEVAEYIEDCKAHNIPVDDNEDILEEKRKAEFFATIGMGIYGYYPN